MINKENDSYSDELNTKQNRYDKVYLNIAKEFGNLTYSTKRKVGAVIVKNDTIIAQGFNGTPNGFDNKCEDDNNKTQWFVLHAEANAILKCAKNGISCDGATLYVTTSPCKDCAKLILQSGITKVVYIDDYKDMSGVDFLKLCGINVIKK